MGISPGFTNEKKVDHVAVINEVSFLDPRLASFNRNCSYTAKRMMLSKSTIRRLHPRKVD